ncbi:MAG: PqqD family protein [Clostridia bacterium]|nr:PqqD family protein [Clostridia bacterium]MBR6619263.1 PqqD family protein [Clostridia bacterium]
MKIKAGYKIRKMCGSSIVIAVGKQAEEFNGMITLNDSAELLWCKLAEGAERQELIDLLCAEYGIDEATAAADVDEFIKTAEGAGLLEQ